MSTDGFRHSRGVKSFGRKQDLRVFSLQVEVHCGSLCRYKAEWIGVTADTYSGSIIIGAKGCVTIKIVCKKHNGTPVPESALAENRPQAFQSIKEEEK